MSVKYLKFSVAIHGLNAEDDICIGFLKGWLKEATKGAILGDGMKKYYNFRNEFEGDIEVKLEEQAGNFSIINED